jgi:DNA-binding transcriptional LysR family regulator
MATAAKTLDLTAVRAFLLVAEMRSFTRTAEAIGTTQSAVSLMLKRLEAALGRRLLVRTPRAVGLTAEGAVFLEHARSLIAANDRAVAGGTSAERRLTLGISDHAAGPELAAMLARLNAFDPGLAIEVEIGFSRPLIEAYDGGKLDAVIVRQEGSHRGGERLTEDAFGWFATPGFSHHPGDKLRLAMLAPGCGVRAVAIRALDAKRLPWREVFVGGGIAAVAAAVNAGIAIAPLARRVAPAGTVDVGPALRLPKLPRSKVMLHSRVGDPQTRAALRTLAAAFRGAAS